jgi:hypothetical protein
MPRGVIYLIILLIIVAGALFLLSTQAREVPAKPVEIDVTNAAGR